MCGYKYDGVNPKWGLDSGESDGKNPLDDIEEVLWDLARMLNGLVKLSRHARIQKLRTVRQALEEVLNQSAVIPLGGPEQVMAQVCKLMPHAEDLDKSMYTLGDIAGMTVTLALSQMTEDVWEGGELDSRAANWVVAKFIQEPFKYAQKKAGSANLCFPVIHSIARAFVDWSGVCGVQQAALFCLKKTTRIMQKDKLILKGKEGFGVLSNCLSVLGEAIGLELLEKMLDWAINAIQRSTVWESRYWAIGFLRSLSEVPFSPMDDIAVVVRERERSIHQVLRSARMDSNLRVRDIAEDVYDAYKRLWTRYIPTASPMSDPPAQETPQSQASGLAPIVEDILDLEGDLPFEFYANLYRGKPESASGDPRMPNAWDIKALQKHSIWDIEPKFDPYAFDWSNWKWPIKNDLGRFAEALRAGGGMTTALDHENDPGCMIGSDLPCGSRCTFFAGEMAV